MRPAQNVVTWFEIPVTDLVRAQKFYESLLGIAMKRADMGQVKQLLFPRINDGAGIPGSLVMGAGYKPSLTGAIIFFTVDNIEASLKKVTEAGGKIVMPKLDIGKLGSIAHFEDSEGNRMGLWAKP
jgi:hypothetical protein